MRDILITGARGALGACVTDRFLAEGDRIWALSRNNTPIPGCHLLTGDLSGSLDAVAEKTGGFDAIIHLASSGSQELSEVIATDVDGMRKLLTHWDRGAFVYCSSQTVYGVPTGVLDETHPLKPETPYDWGKIANEKQLSMVADGFGAGRPGLSLRLGLLFARYQPGAAPQFLDTLTDAILRRRTFVVPDDRLYYTAGSSIIGGRDAADGVCLAAAQKQPEVFNLAGPFVSWKEILDGLAVRLRVPVDFRVRGYADCGENDFILPASISRMPTDKFNQATGWLPQETLGNCLDDYVASLPLLAA